MNFIPAKESTLFMKVFRIYTWWLFKRRFKHVWLKQEYNPDSKSKTVYYLNHHSWWDGLIPFLLNEYRFHQQARALMEDKQMEKYPFFKWIGAFSINREDSRKAITSLRYAVKSFQRENASLFIYPEGSITPAGSPINFEGGLAWLHNKLVGVDFVPVGIYMHTIRHDKPELHLHIGEPISPKKTLTNKQKTGIFEEEIEKNLSDLRKKAGFDDSEFERFL